MPSLKVLLVLTKMFRITFAIAACFAVAGLMTLSQAVRAANSELPLLEYCKHRQFAEAISDFEHLAPAQQSEPANAYIAGFAHFSRQEYNSAAPFLYSCEQQNFKGYPGWPSSKELLDRINVIKKLSPPLFGEFRDGSTSLTVFGVHNEWMDPIYRVLPIFVKRGREGFGSHPTHINLYLFDNKDRYVQFFEAMSGGHKPGADQSGTGVTNLVVFSQFCLDGSSRGVNDLPDRLGCVLHEYGHAMCSTTYGDEFFSVAPGWLNEGLADLVARPLFGREFDDVPARIAREMASAHTPPPSYDDLCHHFYGHGSAPYIMAKLMVARIFGDHPLSSVSTVLATAKAKQGNFEDAIKQVMHVDARTIYDQVVRQNWHS